MSRVTHVQFTYFKEHGKYYSSAELDLPGTMMFHDVLAEIRAMLDRGERPGLVDGHDFHTLVTVYTEHGPLSHLFARHPDHTLMSNVHG